MTSVSIIIPVYQSASTIVETLESVFNQIFKDIEVIVVNDGSTDDLDEKIEPFDEKIIYLKQNNLGAAAARNNGIKHSSGEILAFLDADDIWLPEKLVLQLPLFEQNPKAGVVFGNVFFLHQGRIQSKTYFDLYTPSCGNIFLELFALNFIPMSSVLMRRNVLEQVGFFDESCYVEDYQLWLKISNFWEFNYIQTPVAIYRISPQQMSMNYTRAAASLLQVKEDVYQSCFDQFIGADKNILERGLYNKYLKLALCYMRDAKKNEATQILRRYKHVRGVSLTYVFFQFLIKLPNPLMLAVVKLWDKFYQKPEFGFV